MVLLLGSTHAPDQKDNHHHHPGNNQQFPPVVFPGFVPMGIKMAMTVCMWY